MSCAFWVSTMMQLISVIGKRPVSESGLGNLMNSSSRGHLRLAPIPIHPHVKLPNFAAEINMFKAWHKNGFGLHS